MLTVTNTIVIPDTEFTWSYARSGGPGGQNVNKVASKAVLRWDVRNSPNLPADAKERFLAQQKNRVTTDGYLVISSEKFRDQDRNRQDCLEKLASLVRNAAVRPKVRRPTKPGRGAKERRLKNKRQRSSTKASRRRPVED